MGSIGKNKPDAAWILKNTNKFRNRPDVDWALKNTTEIQLLANLQE